MSCWWSSWSFLLWTWRFSASKVATLLGVSLSTLRRNMRYVYLFNKFMNYITVKIIHKLIQNTVDCLSMPKIAIAGKHQDL